MPPSRTLWVVDRSGYANKQKSRVVEPRGVRRERGRRQEAAVQREGRVPERQGQGPLFHLGTRCRARICSGQQPAVPSFVPSEGCQQGKQKERPAGVTAEEYLRLTDTFPSCWTCKKSRLMFQHPASSVDTFYTCSCTQTRKPPAYATYLVHAPDNESC